MDVDMTGEVQSASVRVKTEQIPDDDSMNVKEESPKDDEQNNTYNPIADLANLFPATGSSSSNTTPSTNSIYDGLLQLSGPSGSGKTNVCLDLASEFLIEEVRLGMFNQIQVIIKNKKGNGSITMKKEEAEDDLNAETAGFGGNNNTNVSSSYNSLPSLSRRVLFLEGRGLSRFPHERFAQMMCSKLENVFGEIGDYIEDLNSENAFIITPNDFTVTGKLELILGSCLDRLFITDLLSTKCNDVVEFGEKYLPTFLAAGSKNKAQTLIFVEDVADLFENDGTNPKASLFGSNNSAFARKQFLFRRAKKIFRFASLLKQIESRSDVPRIIITNRVVCGTEDDVEAEGMRLDELMESENRNNGSTKKQSWVTRPALGLSFRHCIQHSISLWRCDDDLQMRALAATHPTLYEQVVAENLISESGIVRVFFVEKSPALPQIFGEFNVANSGVFGIVDSLPDGFLGV